MLDKEERKRQITQKAVALLAIQERSRFILRRKLLDRFKEAEDKALIEEILNFLEEKDYLSDRRYAKLVIDMKASKYGDQKLKWALRQHGVSDEIIKEEMKALQDSELQRAQAVWESRFGEPPADPKERDRQYRYLSSRGFSFSTVSQVMRGKNKGYF